MGVFEYFIRRLAGIIETFILVQSTVVKKLVDVVDNFKRFMMS